MLANIQINISGCRIIDATNYYPYHSFYETFLSYTKAVQDTRLDIECWKKDTVGQFNDVRLVDAVRYVGNKKRAAKFVQSNTVVLQGRPHLKYYHQNNNISPVCSLFVRLIFAATEFYLTNRKK